MIKHITFKRSAWVRLVAIALWAMTLVTATAADAALELVVPVDAKSARTRKKEIDELRQRLQELQFITAGDTWRQGYGNREPCFLGMLKP